MNNNNSDQTETTYINLLKRITILETRQIDPDRFSRMEAKLNQFCDVFFKNNETNQQSNIRNIKTNERIAAHLENSRRVWERVEELQNNFQFLEKTLIEIKEQHRQMQNFSADIKKAAWIAVTCGGIILWWIIQKWVDSHAN